MTITSLNAINILIVVFISAPIWSSYCFFTDTRIGIHTEYLYWHDLGDIPLT